MAVLLPRRAAPAPARRCSRRSARDASSRATTARRRAARRWRSGGGRAVGLLRRRLGRRLRRLADRPRARGAVHLHRHSLRPRVRRRRRSPSGCARAGRGRRAEWAHIAVAGLLTHAGYLGGSHYAQRWGLSAGVTALVLALQPLLTAVIVSRWLHERLGALQKVGVGVGLAGVALVVGERALAGTASARQRARRRLGACSA